jgi:hypothetical protein
MLNSRALLLIVGCLCLVFAAPLAAQSDALVTTQVALIEQVDLYGQRVQVAQGIITNEGDEAYTSISMVVKLYDAVDALMGEGFGVPVNACGAGLLFDFVLLPGESQAFAAPIEIFEPEVTIARTDVIVSAEAISADALPAVPTLNDAITQVTDQEVIALEWEDNSSFRYAVGCERDLFTAWQWQRYDGASARTRPLDPPGADNINDEMRARISLTDPLIFANSRLRYAPISGARIVYQDRINDVWTAAEDGRFIRKLHTGLNSYSLQGYVWLPQDRFLAYYYGAYGDPVRYFTADAEGRVISPQPLRNRPSVIVPGASADAQRVILAGTFDDVTGYYILNVTQNFFELLFEAEPPGNNYPPPVPLLNVAGNRVTRIYLIRPVDGEDRLQCFYRPEEGESALIDLAPLPLSLAIDERAWSYLSPDESTLAISANGVNGGLWLIDLEALPACGEPG